MELTQAYSKARDCMGERRADLAIDWLTKTPRPLGRIGADLGFADAAAFYRAFAAWTGCGPREYRKRFGQATAHPARAHS